MPKLNAIEYIDKKIEENGKELGLKNRFAYPKINKVVINVGIGKIRADKKLQEMIVSDILKITGQKPKINKAKKSVASFKVKVGENVGYTVTLRGKKMKDFICKLINVSLPAIRDFRGLPLESMDVQGNYSLGIKEYSVFPEISFGEESANYGMQVTLQIKSNCREDAKKLLEKLGFPFKKEVKNA